MADMLCGRYSSLVTDFFVPYISSETAVIINNYSHFSEEFGGSHFWLLLHHPRVIHPILKIVISVDVGRHPPRLRWDQVNFEEVPHDNPDDRTE